MSVDEPLIQQTTINHGRFLVKKFIIPIFIFALLIFIVFGTFLNNKNDQYNSFLNEGLNSTLNESLKLESNQTNDPIFDILLGSNDSSSNNLLPNETTFNEENKHDVITNITNAMNEFLKLTGPEFYSLDAMRNISSANDEFLDLFGNVAKYLSDKMLTGVKQNTTDYNAFYEFYKTMGPMFETIGEYERKLKTHLPNYFLRYKYQNQIQDTLEAKIWGVTSRFYPSQNFSFEREYFLLSCNSVGDCGIDRMYSLMSYFYLGYHSIDRDRNISKTYSEFYHVFDLIENHPNFKGRFWYSNKYQYNDYYEADKLRFFNSIKYKTERYDEGWDYYKNDLMKLIGLDWRQVRGKFYELNPYMDDAVITTDLAYCTSGGREFENDLMLDVISLCRIDALKIEFIYTLCTFIEHSSIFYELALYKRNRLKEETSPVLNGLVGWVEMKKSLVWPEITKLYAKRGVGFKSINETTHYNETAEKVRQKLMTIGNEDYDYQVLIMPNWQFNDYWIASSDNNNDSIIIENYQNINVVIRRYKKDVNVTELLEAKKLFNEKRQIIEGFLSEHETESNLTQIFEKMRQQISFDTSPFNSFVFVYNSKLLASECQVPIGMSNNTIESVDLYEKIEHFYNPWFLNAKRFKLFFMM